MRQVGLSQLGRIILVWLITAGALMLLSAILPGLHVKDPEVALVAAAMIGLINALVWPVLIRIALPFTVLTLGLGVLVLNGAVILLVSQLEPGFKVDDLLTGIVAAVGLTIVNTILTSLLALDDDDFWYRNVVRRQAKRMQATDDFGVPGVYFLEIDGCAHGVLQRAIRDGNAPNIASWIRNGDHRLLQWETDWSSQTGACQAGLLHGNNHDIPAFRWWEKDLGKPIVTNHPKDAAEIERRASDGKGLLHEDGASRANIVSGDAVHTLLTMSTVLDRSRPGRLGQDYFAYFANPYNMTRTIMFVIADILAERHYAKQQRRNNITPRIRRDRKYALMRAWGTVIQTDLQVNSVISDLYAGRPVGYSTFLAYDEVAHHSGVERVDALSTLKRVDRQIGRIVAAAKDAPRPYRFVVLSDHGQSQGATFLDRYGLSLEELVTQACDSDQVQTDAGEPSEAMDYLGASLTEAAGGDTVAGRAVSAATKNRRVDGAVQLDKADRESTAGDGIPELSVMASGCLGLITFPRERGRVTLEEIDDKWPKLIHALTEHPGIGFILVRSKRDGAVVIGPRGKVFLDKKNRVTGEDPLAPYGPNAARHVARTDSFEHCPDIVVNSTYWTETDEVAAFEELVGSHGGMGGGQSFPFALIPSDWTQPEEPVVGAEKLHLHFRQWLTELGHSSYEDRPG
jgi:uncharacterized membrane protein YvlD (DUF360 family)